MLASALSGQLEPVGDADRVDAAVEEGFGLLEEGAAEDDDAGRAVADLVVLRLGQLHHQLGDLAETEMNARLRLELLLLQSDY